MPNKDGTGPDGNGPKQTDQGNPTPKQDPPKRIGGGGGNRSGKGRGRGGSPGGGGRRVKR